MKFEYKENVEDRECVAYIDREGDLILKRDDGYCIWLSIGGAIHVHDYKFNPLNAEKKFYRGDIVTITF